MNKDSKTRPLTRAQILAWAETHHQRTGRWPAANSGGLADCPEENWAAIDRALRYGCRGLPAGGSLAKLLRCKKKKSERRGRPPFSQRGRLTTAQVLAWVDAHRARTGTWPSANSGPVVDCPGENWRSIDLVLRYGGRGLPAGRSLSRLLRSQRNLTVSQILAWVDAHRDRTGDWPAANSGPLADCPEENWRAIDLALRFGYRGLPGGESLYQLLRPKRNLTVSQILAWADAHRDRTGNWPMVRSGAVFDCAEENWQAIDQALRNGNRGLPGGETLARLLCRERGAAIRRGPLPKVDRQVVSRLHAKGLSIAEIARHLGVSPATITKRIIKNQRIIKNRNKKPPTAAVPPSGGS